MAAAPLTLRAFYLGAAAVLGLEFAFHAAGAGAGPHGAWSLLGLRLVQTAAMIAAAVCFGRGLSSFGLSRTSLARDVFRGALWCLGFAGLASAGMGVLYWRGLNPFALFPNPLPPGAWAAAAYLLGAGLVGPLAEEFFFRGLVFGFFRRWGAAAAVIGSTLLFALCHQAGSRLPVTQIVGGLVFALAYEREKSLIAPLMIHVSGNLALAGVGWLAAG